MGSHFPYLTLLVLIPAGAGILVPVVASVAASAGPAAERRAVQVVGWGAVLVTLVLAAVTLDRFSSRRRRVPDRHRPRLDRLARHLLDTRASTASRCSSSS